MGSHYTLLENLIVENWVSFGIFILSVLFVIYKYRSQDDHVFKPNHITHRPRPTSNTTKCSKPDCVRCRARAKERMYLETQRRMEHILSDVGKLQDGVSERLRNSFERQRTTGVTHKVDGKEHESHPWSSTGAREISTSLLQNPSMFYLQQLSREHIFQNFKDFPNYVKLVSVIKSHFSDVREEFDIVWNDFLEGNNIGGWQENALSEGKWYTFHLMNQGKKQRYNMQRCPNTSKMLDTLEPLMTNCMFGFATFSVVMPGTHIESHCGATNVRLRCHLGLHIPEGCCSLTVNGELLHWKENECLVFDDSFLHEAEHYGNEHSSPRSVLMLDVWHPCLSSEEKNILKYVFHSDVIQN